MASDVGPTKRALPWNCSMPIFAHASIVRSVVGSISECLKRMSAGQSMVSWPAGTPLSAMSRAPLTASAAPTRIFFGTQPRSAHVPPNGCESTTATAQPASRHREATAEVTPVPTTTRSKCRSMEVLPTLIRTGASRESFRPYSMSEGSVRPHGNISAALEIPETPVDRAREGGITMPTHKVVKHDEWLKARRKHLAKEKEFTRMRDQLSRERRDLPWELVEKQYTFEGEHGTRSFGDL